MPTPRQRAPAEREGVQPGLDPRDRRVTGDEVEHRPGPVEGDGVRTEVRQVPARAATEVDDRAVTWSGPPAPRRALGCAAVRSAAQSAARAS